MDDRSRSGWYMPAEWLPHAATWCSWPRNRETWAHNLADAQVEFVGLVRAIAADEPVRVMAGEPEDAAAARRALAGIGDVEVIPFQTNDAWARDYGPTFVLEAGSGRLGAVDWTYNAWGGKYPPFDQDQAIARKVAAWTGCQHLPVDLCLEGGALEVDADGMLLCTRSCAFDPHRNPGLDPGTISQRIATAIGATASVWLDGDCLVGDDTDGHIDQLARFTPAGPILYAWTDDRSDPQQAGLQRNLEDLREGLEKAGKAPPLVPLPLPEPVFFRGVQIPACYCNYYLTNGSVIVPAFGAPQDDAAARIIAEHHPGRRLVTLPSRNLTVGLGSFHCLTQQQPSVGR